MNRGAAPLIALAILAACNDRNGRPPFANGDDDNPSPPADDADVPFIPLPSGGETPCDTRIEVPIVKPNFYFVLDASGSMLEKMPGTNENRYRTAVSAISVMLTPMQEHVNFGAAVFPNSFKGASCVAGNEVFKLRDGSVTGQSSPLDSLTATLRGFVPEGGSPVSSTLRELYPTLHELPGKTFVVLLTDGAPNCNLSRSCTAKDCIPNLEGVAFSDGTTCNADFNCCAPDWFPHLCLDGDPTLDELTRLAEVDVSTYVIGLPGGNAYADLLNRMAIAGRTARDRQAVENVDQTARDAGMNAPLGDAASDATSDTSDDGLLYYQVTDAESLGIALSAVRQAVLIECTLELDFAPKSAELLSVTADDEELATESWQLVADTRIELLGAVCDDWKAGKLTDVRVREACRGDVR